MRCKNFWQRLIPFFLTFLISLPIVEFLSYETSSDDLEHNEVAVKDFSHKKKNLYSYITKIKTCVPADLKFIKNTLNKRKFELIKQLDKNKLTEEVRNEIIEELIKVKLDINKLENFENTSKNGRFESQVINLLYLEKCL